MLHEKPRLQGDLDDYGFGRLCLNGESASLSYQPYEISKHFLGIMTDRSLSSGSVLQLRAHPGKLLSLKVLRSLPASPANRFKRYLLQSTDTSVDMEQIFVQNGCFKKQEILQKRQIQATRYPTVPAIQVDVSTFGSTSIHRLQTINISKSGLLLTNHGLKHAPFIVNTLVELSMIDRGGWLQKPIYCLGKVIRRMSESNNSYRGHQEFGIKIVELDESYATIWYDIIGLLSEQAVSRNAC